MTVRQNSLKNFVFEELNDNNRERSPTSTPTHLLIAQISLRKNQPRRYFDPQKLAELTQSIRQHGILEPLLVRPLERSGQPYELVAGERRYRAALEAGLLEVPVTLRELTENEAIAISLIENLQREDLNPVEETEGILQLLGVRLDLSLSEVIATLYRMRNELSGSVSQNVLTNDTGKEIQEIFESIGTINWKSFITARLPLLKLPSNILEALRQGKIAYTKAQVIATVKEEGQRQKLLNEALAQDYSLVQIKEKIKNLTTSQPITDSPKNRIRVLTTQLTQNKLWEKDAKKWKKIEALLSKLETLLEEDLKLPN